MGEGPARKRCWVKQNSPWIKIQCPQNEGKGLNQLRTRFCRARRSAAANGAGSQSNIDRLHAAPSAMWWAGTEDVVADGNVVRTAASSLPTVAAIGRRAKCIEA